jgi:hypothetical protein
VLGRIIVSVSGLLSTSSLVQPYSFSAAGSKGNITFGLMTTIASGAFEATSAN